MKPEKLILVLFVCMGILLAMMYGAFEIGGLEMGKCGKWILKAVAIGFAVMTVAVIIVCICCIDCDNANHNKICLNGDAFLELEGDLHSFYVLKDEKKDKAPKKTQAVIYCGSDVLKQSHFDDTGSLKCLAFAGNSCKIEKDLYTTLIANNVNITICNGNVLTLVNKDGDAVSSVRIERRKKPEKQQERDVTGEIDLSVHKK